VAHVGDGIRAEPGAWSFGGDTARHFDEHVRRSVPYYTETHRLIESVSERYVASGSRVYDLGCSTGALTARLAARHAGRAVDVVGIDREPNMVVEARARCAEYTSVAVVEADLVDFELRPARVVVAHYTVQFIAPGARGAVIEGIASALHGGGVFLLFEKVREPNARLDALTVELYHDWKRTQGYADDEIVAKARSLEGVLQPFTSEENRELLRAAGFAEVTTVFRWLNWEGLLAVAG
jgi:tRNA (cmo5U34)-methyltransferase